jgi:hypothetical protein
VAALSAAFSILLPGEKPRVAVKRQPYTKDELDLKRAT